MSVKKEPDGRRSVQVEVEVQGTPEQVWQAIATGPGISAWFVPTELEGQVGGKLACDFGGGMVSSAEITAWQPPRRFVATDSTWLPGGPPVATEWTVEAKRGGTCIVRVVHSLFASTDDWDQHIEGTESGWPGYFKVLAHYLAHHAGERAASFVAMAPAGRPVAETWAVLLGALGSGELVAGRDAHLRAPAGAAPVRGVVKSVDHLPQGTGATLHVREPAPGVVMVYAMECMGMQMASLQAFYYGPRADAAAADKERWVGWLNGLFPAPPAG